MIFESSVFDFVIIAAYCVAVLSAFIIFKRYKQMQEQLKALKYSQQIGVMMSRGLVVFDADGQLTYADDFAKICAPFFAADEERNLHYSQCLEYLGVLAQRAVAMAGAGAFRHVDVSSEPGVFQEVLPGPDGAFVLVQARRLDDQQRALIFSGFDVIKPLETEMYRHKKRALVTMAAGIIHNFNNSLSIIDGHVRLLMKRPEGADSVSVLKISETVKRVCDFNAALMDFCGVHVDLKQAIDLKALLMDEKAAFYNIVPDNMTLHLSDNESAAHVMTYGDALRKVMRAFMQHLVQSSKGATGIYVGLQRAVHSGQDYWRIAMTSDVDGMNEADIHCLFDPYSLVTAKDDSLALPQAQGIVGQHGGFIEVDHQPGMGTTYRIYLPCSDAVPKQEIQGDASNPASIRLSDSTILIVDDDIGILDIVSSMLKDLGADVLMAKHANEALLIMDEHESQIDLVLSDIVMPDMNGVQLYELITAMSPDVRFMFMSAFPGRGQASPITMPGRYRFNSQAV